MSDKSLAVREQTQQRNLITHAVLTGLTPLIPVPLVDDLVKNYFLRRMVRSLAAAHGRQLKQEEVLALTEERGEGCLRGCLLQTFVLPLKLIFRKVFFFLEWKRAVDLTSHTYHLGFLVDYALRQGWIGAPSSSEATTATDLRAALEVVCRESPIRPVEAAVRLSFRQSRNMLRAGAQVLGRAVRRVTGKPDEKQLEESVAAVEAEEERAIEGVVGKLQQALEAIPEDHFRQLQRRLAQQLKR